SAAALQTLATRLAGENQRVKQLLNRDLVVLGAEGLTVETKELGHGEMTYALLQGLNGEADSNHDGIVTVKELQSYFTLKTPSRQETSFNGFAVGKDFALGSTGSLPAVKMRGPTVDPDTVEAASVEKITTGKNYALLFATDNYDDSRWPHLDN